MALEENEKWEFSFNSTLIFVTVYLWNGLHKNKKIRKFWVSKTFFRPLFTHPGLKSAPKPNLKHGFLYVHVPELLPPCRRGSRLKKKRQFFEVNPDVDRLGRDVGLDLEKVAEVEHDSHVVPCHQLHEAHRIGHRRRRWI